MKRIEVVGSEKVFLGRLGDDNVREFAFDITEWSECMDDTYSISCIFVPHNGSGYALRLDKYWREGKWLVWVPTATETATLGWAKFEAHLYNNDQEISTLIWNMNIGKSLFDDGDPPSGWENYILAIEKLVDEIENMTVSASVDSSVGTPSVTVETSGGSGEPFSISLAFHNLKGETGGQGEQGVGIALITIAEKSTSGLNVTYTLTATKTDGTTTASDFTVTNGNGIASAELNDDYTLTLYFDDGTSYTTPSIRGEQGEQGEQGETGVGISNISVTKTSTVGLVDTYTMVITYTDGTSETETFEVTNGEGQSGTALPLMDGTATVGTSLKWSHEDHVHPHDTSLLPTDTVNGNPISISDGFPVNAMGLVVDVEPIQDLHGYDNPWPGGGGKNLIDLNGFQSTTTSITPISKGVTVAVTNAGNNRYAAQYLPLSLLGKTVTFHADVSVSSTNYASVRMYYTGNGSIVGDAILNISGAGSKTGTATIADSLPEGADAIRLQLYACTTGTTSVGTSATYDNLQLEVGSSATAWTPYSNICPISGYSEVSVVRSGKNLFDEANANWKYGYYLDNTGAEHLLGGYKYSQAYTECDSDTDYYFSFVKNMSSQVACSVCEYNSSKQFIKRTVLVSATTATGLLGGTFKTTGNTMYLRFSVPFQVDYDTTDCFLDIGTASRTVSLTIPLGQTVYGGTVDVTNGVVRVTHKITSGIIESLPVYVYTNIQYGRFVKPNDSKNKGNANVYGMISSMYEISSATGNWDNADKIGKMFVGADYNWIWIGFPVGTTLAEMQEITNNNVICYELATPIEVTLTPQQLMMLLGDNVLTSDGTITLDYYCDVTRYIAKKIAELQALILEG